MGKHKNYGKTKQAKMRIAFAFCIAILGLFSACKDSEEEIKKDTLFTALTPEETGVQFINKVVNQKNFK